MINSNKFWKNNYNKKINIMVPLSVSNQQAIDFGMMKHFQEDKCNQVINLLGDLWIYWDFEYSLLLKQISV